MKLQKLYNTTNVHVAGEVFRIIHDVPLVHYRSLQELEEKLPAAFSEEISLLVKEPRGFAGINGCLVVPPVSKEADIAAIFFSQEGTVSDHYGGIVAVLTALLENGQLKEKESGEYLIETVQGILSASAVMEKEQVVSVGLKLGGCSLIQADAPLNHSAYTVVQADQRYALFNKSDVNAPIELKELSALKKWGQSTLQALESDPEIQGVILMDDCSIQQGRLKTITFRKDGWIIRSPGFGPTAACLASLLSKGDIKPDEAIKNESIFGSFLEARAEQKGGKYQFNLEARGFITGLQTFVLDPTDPLPEGFLIQ